MKWEPWETFKEVRRDPVLPIAMPPCQSCRWWQPRQITFYVPKLRCSITDKVRLCWVLSTGGYMESDFSCYEPIEGDNNAT